MSLNVRAKEDVELSEVLRISSEYTKAEAYREGEQLDVQLSFVEGAEAQGAFRLYQNQPNPWKEATVIGFMLPESGEVSLSIFDVST